MPAVRLDFYAFDRTRSFATYDDALSEAIVLPKYGQVTRLGDCFAERLAEIVAQAPADWRAPGAGSAATTRRN